jgi:hypothetical protein
LWFVHYLGISSGRGCHMHTALAAAPQLVYTDDEVDRAFGVPHHMRMTAA